MEILPVETVILVDFWKITFKMLCSRDTVLHVKCFFEAKAFSFPTHSICKQSEQKWHPYRSAKVGMSCEKFRKLSKTNCLPTIHTSVAMPFSLRLFADWVHWKAECLSFKKAFHVQDRISTKKGLQWWIFKKSTKITVSAGPIPIYFKWEKKNA